MKEIKDILRSYYVALKAGKRTALATVVHVEGSSYRRPGARMLVTEDGELTGAISGGCLEGDALRKALLVINQQENKLVTYDTTDEDDAQFGVQLGCNGIVHILFEPISPQSDHPLQILQLLASKRRAGVLVTIFSLQEDIRIQPGTCLLYADNEVVLSTCKLLDAYASITEDARAAFQNSCSATKEYPEGKNLLTAFVEFVNPITKLVIAGAGNDAIPLVKIASVLGWETIVADGRANLPTPLRFPDAEQLIVAKPDALAGQIEPDPQTVFVLMTHNYNYDRDLLRALLPKNCAYIGSLGPKKKLERMLAELRSEGIIISDEQLARIFGPVGLDIGSETSEEIALSIVSEIKAVLSARQGTSLKNKIDPIHSSGAAEWQNRQR